MKEYVKVRADFSIYPEDVDPSRFLAHTVHEDYELIDTGVLDESGNRIMARRKMDQIGFIRRE